MLLPKDDSKVVMKKFLLLNERNLTILRRSELAKTRGVTKSSCCRVNPLLSWLPPPTLPLSLFPGIHLSFVELHFIRIYFQELAVTPNFWQVNWIWKFAEWCRLLRILSFGLHGRLCGSSSSCNLGMYKHHVNTPSLFNAFAVITRPLSSSACSQLVSQSVAEQPTNHTLFGTWRTFLNATILFLLFRSFGLTMVLLPLCILMMRWLTQQNTTTI